MTRRQRGETDSLNPVNVPRWLVVRDRVSRVLEYVPLAPGVDLHGALDAKGAALAAEGWRVRDIPRNCSFFFCECENDRWYVSVEHFEPGHIPVSHGSHIGKR
jgi:hypothetical protein